MIVILGGGLTGLTVAWLLNKKKVDFILIEKEDKLGGLCKSVLKNGFIFDYTGHYLHFQKEQKQAFSFILNFFKNDLIKIKRNAKVFTKYAATPNSLIEYPFQANISFLNDKVKSECVEDFLRSKLFSECTNDNFENWLFDNFGKSITEYFFKPYNEKLWKEKIKNIDVSWAKKFVPIVEVEEFFDNVIFRKNKNYGYNIHFYYPKKPGISTLIDFIAKDLNKKNILTNAQVLHLDYENKTLIFSLNNKNFKIRYDKIINTIPLVELIKFLKFPKKILKYFKFLRWVGVLCFNIALKRKIFEGTHWIYFPDEDVSFYRIGFYHNVNYRMVPFNKGSLYVEVSYRPNQKIYENEVCKHIVSDLVKTKILNSSEDIMFIDLLKIPYAYVIYDRKRNEVLPIIFRFLKKHNIYSIGRYGAWKYSYMTENVQDAIELVRDLFPDE